MTPAEISEEVLDILSDIAPDEDLSQLDDEVRFREQLELDSMDFLDIVMELRKRHRVQVPEADYIQLASMSSTVAYLEPLLKDVEREKVPKGRPAAIRTEPSNVIGAAGLVGGVGTGIPTSVRRVNGGRAVQDELDVAWIS